MNLPVKFTESMKILLHDEYDEFIKSYDDRPYSGIRINTSKISCEDFEKIAPYGISKIPYISNGYFIDDTDGWSKHPYYYAGLYYIQEPSAMLPARILQIEEGDIVCDLCAAPGGKSTELSCKNPEILLSNDISHSRAIPLVKNLELFGKDNYFVTCQNPRDLADRFPETFDKILVDAPCSGEGMFRKDTHLIVSYEKKGPDYYSSLQRDILENAYKMLSPGGSILYSTCTFSDIENEQVIISMLSSHDDLYLENIQKEYGLSAPYVRYSDMPAIDGCVHALPHRFKGEGHFAALIRKTGTRTKREIKYNGFMKYGELSAPVKDFARYLSDDYMDHFVNKRFIVSQDAHIYMVPDSGGVLYDKSIRYLRTGVCIGSVGKSGHFNAHTAFALSLKHDDFKNCLDLSSKDEAIRKYLKGETIVFDVSNGLFCPKGYVLVCVDSYPLGFGLSDGRKLKNLYEKGWVYR